MYSYLYVLKEEILFSMKKKKNYLYQTITNYLERIIFLTGMTLLLCCNNNTLTLTNLLKATFWFILVNGFLEISQRVESEMRLKQFNHCFNLKTSYWMILFMRIIALLFDSLLIAIISICILSLFVPIIIDISLYNIVIYSLMMLFQYVIFQFVFTYIAIYFQRIQAIMRIMENYIFFYSGMVIVSGKYSLYIFKIMNNIINNNYQEILILFALMIIEMFILFIGNKAITRYIKNS